MKQQSGSTDDGAMAAAVRARLVERKCPVIFDVDKNQVLPRHARNTQHQFV